MKLSFQLHEADAGRASICTAAFGMIGLVFVAPAAAQNMMQHLSTLNEGQHIEYEIEENRGKTSAVNLKVK